MENGELLIELAEAFERFDAESGHESAEPVRAFLNYRSRVGGPFFGRPEPEDELAEALVEWALEHPDAFVAASSSAI